MEEAEIHSCAVAWTSLPLLSLAHELECSRDQDQSSGCKWARVRCCRSAAGRILQNRAPSTLRKMI